MEEVKESPETTEKGKKGKGKDMCRQLVVMNKLSLGARELGWEAWVLPKGEVQEFTGKQLKDIIRGGKEGVYGLELSEESGELAFDKGFFTTNMMNKVHINTLEPMEEGECPVNLFYVVTGSRKGKNGTMYEVVSSRYERKELTEENARVYLEMGIISGGAKLENGEIVLAAMDRGL